MATQVKTAPRETKTLPRLPGRPLVGNALEFRKDRLKFLLSMAHTGDACGMQFGPFSGILFNKPEHVQSILVEHADDFDLGNKTHRIFHDVIADSIFSIEGELHRRERKLIAPPFQPRHIASYADIIGQYAEHIQRTWVDGSIIDIKRQMTALTLSIIGKTLFDADVFTETDELAAALSIAQEYIVQATISLVPIPFSWPTPRNRRTHRALSVLNKRIVEFIDERRNNPSARNDLLSILLQAKDEDGHHMSDQQVQNECLGLFAAGHQTIAAALTWAWYLLCQHPESSQQVEQEATSVLQGRTPTYADLEHMPYCLQVLKEAIRLYPPAFVLLRYPLHDIEIDGYHISKNMFVLLSPYTMHRRKDNFPDPEHFDPTRFTPDREKQLPRHAYFPFGAGPRICLGMYFALMEGHLLLTALAQRVNFSLIPSQTIKPDLEHHQNTMPDRAILVRVKKK